MNGNIKILMGLSTLVFFQSINAGTMGEVSPEPRSIVPFVSAEGFPLWVDFGGLNVVQLTPATETVSHSKARTIVSGGGRGAAGLAYRYRDNVDFTFETGWNYFGNISEDVPVTSTNSNVSNTDISVGATLTGADFLVGAAYRMNSCELFLKAGTLIQRLDYNVKASGANDTDTTFFEVKAKGVLTQVLPEVKVGLAYDFNPNWAVSAAYMYAYGGTPKVNAVTTETTTVTNHAANLDLHGPSLNSVLFGLHYRFA